MLRGQPVPPQRCPSGIRHGTQGSLRLGPRNARRAGALTLVELLIALALLSLVVTLVLGSFFQISTGATGIQDELSEQQELRLLLKLVSDDLLTARYLQHAAEAHLPTGIKARMHLLGRGEFTEINYHAATRARFYRLRPAELDPLLHEIGYSAQEEGDTGRFTLMRREQYYLDSDLERGGVTVELARNLEVFQVEFLKPPAAPGSTLEEWDKEWDSTQRPDGQRMPVAMRVTIGRGTKDKRHLKDTLEFNMESVLRLNR